MLRIISSCLLALCACVAADLSAAEKSPLAIDDLYRLDAVTDLAVTPDGKSAFYIRQWNSRGQKLPQLALWRVDGSPERRRALEPDQPDARRPVISPDGKWLAFLSTRPRGDGSPTVRPVPYYSEPATDIWLVSTDGGRAIPLSGKDKPYGRVLGDPFYGRVAFSPDGKQLAFVADKGSDARTSHEREIGVTIVREDQGEGYEGYGPAQVWLAELEESPRDQACARVRRLTDDDVWYGDPQWTPDGRSLIVHANRTRDRESVRFSINKNFDLWKIDCDSGKLAQLTSGIGPDVSPRISPDGKRVAYLSVPRKGPHADVYNVAILELDSANAPPQIALAAHDAGGDALAYPSFPLPADAWLDERTFYCDGQFGCQAKRVFFELDGDSAKQARATDDAPSAYAERQQRQKVLAPASNSFLHDRLPPNERVVKWKSFDGQEVEGVLTTPHDSIAKPPYKLLLMPHGGPHGRVAPGFNFPVHLFAAQGYAVFQPNFRGSTGYGRKFLDADRGDFGGGDMKDILTGIDFLVREKTIDRERQFVYGTSYGGYMTSWLIGHTNQFRAAAPQNAVTDLSAMWGLSDIQSWTEWEFGGRPWEVPDLMRKHSPISYAGAVRTPTLILHADHDRRCPLAMGQMFHRSLKSAGVETEMVIYHDERHGIVQLPHLEDIYTRVLAWFEQHDVKR